MNTTAIIGLGLIGGSFGLGMQKASLQHRLLGVDQNPEHATTALSRGLVHEICDLEEAIERSSLILLAIPVTHSKDLLKQILDRINPQATVIDMGSTKGKLCGFVENHPMRSRYVAAHPMAGTEYSGPAAALEDLFHNKRVIICEAEKSAADAIGVATQLFSKLQMSLSFMDATSHDLHAAYISHLSHITSFALSLAVLDAEKDESNILDMAGSGFESTVRLAKSASSMWTPIFVENKESVLEALGEYQEYIKAFQSAIEAGDQGRLSELMNRANDIGRIL